MNTPLTVWLGNIGLGKYAAAFAENDIDLDVLPELTDQDLQQLGISLGHRRRLLRAIADGAELALRAPRGEAERRHLTVMFCDLVGSTALSTRFDPEELRDIVRAFQDGCKQIIKSYGGYIARYMGDGLLVYFGYPSADEYDPERAVRAGVDVIKAVGALKVRANTRLQTRIGIATGPVVVGDLIGEGFAQERAVVGETPNLAQRLQQLAEPDMLVIADATRRLIGKLFEYHDLGRHELEGFDQAIQVWSIGDELVVESRFKAIHPSFELVEMVGRQSEVETLLERFERARGGSGQAVLISGEAGIGKSRLAYALCERIRDRPHALLSYFCVPHHEGSTLYPMINQLQRAAGFAREDGGEARLAKLRALAEASSVDPDEVVPVLAALLSIPATDAYPPLDMSPERQKERTLAALEALIVALARNGAPAVVVLEDLHWIDPTTLELVQQLCSRLPKLPLLLLLTARSGEFDGDWAKGEHALTMNLDRLPREQIEELITQVARGAAIAPRTIEQIVEKSDGVPFFVEELTKTVIESGIAGEASQHASAAVALPGTLKQSLAARIDRLGPAKTMLQLCATLGLEFDYRLLRAVYRPEDEHAFRTEVSYIVSSGFLSQTGVPPRSSYAFTHALIQETAYESLLRSTRLERHRQIAEILEEHFPETAELRPEELALHHQNAGQRLSSAKYWLAACDKALKSFANLEAARLAERGLETLGLAPRSVETEALAIKLRIKLARALLATKGYAAPEVSENFRIARDLCEQVGDPPETFQIQVGMWMYYVISGQWGAGREIAEKLARIAESKGTSVHVLQAQYCLGFTLYHLGELEEAERVFQYALSVEEDGVNYADQAASGDDTRVHVRCMLAHVYLHLGKAAVCAEFTGRALDMAAALNHPYGDAFTSFMTSLLYQLKRQPELAREYSARTIRVASEKGFRYWIPLASSIHSWASAHADAGAKRGGSRDGMAVALESYLAMGAGGGQTLLSAALAEESIAAGDYERGAHWLAHARRALETTGERVFEAELARLEALLWRAAGTADSTAVEARIREALAIAGARNNRLLALRAAGDLARLLADVGRTDEAREVLTQARGNMPEDSELPDWQMAKRLQQKIE